MYQSLKEILAAHSDIVLDRGVEVPTEDFINWADMGLARYDRLREFYNVRGMVSACGFKAQMGTADSGKYQITYDYTTKALFINAYESFLHLSLSQVKAVRVFVSLNGWIDIYLYANEEDSINRTLDGPYTHIVFTPSNREAVNAYWERWQKK